jgi:cell division protein FtsB
MMVLTIILAYIIFSPSGVINRIILTNKKAELLQKIESENRTRDSLDKQIKKIVKDTTEIEKIAREKYGMKFPGEKIYIVPAKKKTPKE